MKKNRLNRFLAVMMAAVLLSSCLPAALAEAPADEPAPVVTATPQPTPEPTPAPTEAPAEEAEPTSAPAEAPAEEAEPTPAPAEAPAEEAEPTSAPTEAPAEEAEPSPAPTEAPAEEAEPSPAPTEAPAEEAETVFEPRYAMFVEQRTALFAAPELEGKPFAHLEQGMVYAVQAHEHGAVRILFALTGEEGQPYTAEAWVNGEALAYPDGDAVERWMDELPAQQPAAYADKAQKLPLLPLEMHVDDQPAAPEAPTASVEPDASLSGEDAQPQGVPALTGIKITGKAAISKAGGTLQLGVQPVPAGAVLPAVAWSSSSDLIATVDANGLVTAHGNGKVAITAAAGDLIAQKTVTVSRQVVAPKAVTISHSAKLVNYKSIALQADFVPVTTTQKKLRWTVEGNPYAAITSAGKLTVKDPDLSAPTTLTVRATSTVDESVTATLQVVCYPAPATLALTAAEPDVATLYIGSATQSACRLTAAISPANAAQDILWKTSNKKVATVDENGMVTAVGTGKATITAYSAAYPNVKATRVFKVEAPVRAIALRDQKKLGVALVGKTLQLYADLTPAKPTNKKVEWSLSDNAAGVATISAAGKLTVSKTMPAGLRYPYTVTVYAKALGAEPGCADVTAEYDVDIYPVTTKMTLTPAPLKLDLSHGATAQLTPAFTPADSAKAVVWKSSNAAVAAVDENGNVTGLKNGTATITATLQDGTGKKATAKVTVVTGVTGVQLDGPAVVAAGKSVQLVTTLSPAAPSDKKVTYTVSNPALASVSASGKVTAKPGVAGSVTVTVTTRDGGYADTHVLQIMPPVTSVEIRNASGRTQLGLGDDELGVLQLSAVCYPQQALQQVQWSSSAAAVASVDADGLVTAHKSGAAQITATAMDGSGKKAVYSVRVVVLATDVTITTVQTELAHGMSLQMRADVTPADATNRTVAWSLSGAAAPYATISAAGMLAIAADAPQQPLELVVTATAQGAGQGRHVSASHTITVRPAPQSVTIEHSLTPDSDNQGYYTLEIDTTAQLSATVLPETASPAVTWNSSVKSVATVDENGLITAKRPGTTRITAKAINGKSAGFTLWVIDTLAFLAPNVVEVRQTGAGTVYVEWAPAHADHVPTEYFIYRTGTSYNYDNARTTATSKTLSGLSVGTHRYSIGSSNLVGNTYYLSNPNTFEIVVVPCPSDAYASPVGLAALATAANEVTLTWQPKNANLAPDSYMVQRLDSGEWTDLGYVSSPSALLTGQPAGEQTYRVVACVNGEMGLASARITVVVARADDPAYLAPVNLTGVCPADGQVTLNWQPADSANPPDRYAVYQATRTGYKLRSVTTNTAITLTDLAGGTYEYRVEAQVLLSSGAYDRGAMSDPVTVVVTGGAKYRALLVAQSDYSCDGDANDEGDLAATPQDVAAMAAMLTHGQTAYDVTSHVDISKNGVFSAIRSTFEDAGDNDVSLFFFSGHGVNAGWDDSFGREYTGALGIVGGDCITGAELANAFADVPGTVIVILECCHGGNMIWDGNTLTTVDTPFDQAAFSASFLNAFSRMEGTGLQSGELRQSKYHVIAAAAYNKSGYECNYSTGYGYGFLTYALAKGVDYQFNSSSGYYWGNSGMAADANDDGVVTVGEAYLYAVPVISEELGSDQDPQLYPAGSTQPLFFE